MGRDRYKVIDKENRPYFVTCTVIQWIPLFRHPQIAQVVLDSLRFLHERQRLTNHGFVLMENHLHLLVSSSKLSAEIIKFKSFTARSIVDFLKEDNMRDLLEQLEFHKLRHKHDQQFQVRQEGFHPEVILNTEMFRIKLDYIHNNPVKRGYVEEPGHWRYSSWKNYMEGQGMLPVELIG